MLGCDSTDLTNSVGKYLCEFRLSPKGNNLNQRTYQSVSQSVSNAPRNQLYRPTNNLCIQHPTLIISHPGVSETVMVARCNVATSQPSSFNFFLRPGLPLIIGASLQCSNNTIWCLFGDMALSMKQVPPILTLQHLALKLAAQSAKRSSVATVTPGLPSKNCFLFHKSSPLRAPPK